MRYSILDKVNRLYFFTGIVVVLVSFALYEYSQSYYFIINVITFISYSYLLHFCAQRNGDFFSKPRLAVTVFMYSFIFLLLFYSISFYYDGDIMLFSKADANLYKEVTNNLIRRPFLDSIEYLVSLKWGYDDWGAFFSISLIRRIFADKVFLNLVYLLLNTIGAVSLFDIGLKIMNKKYAYLAALTYSVSSYVIFFSGTFLKESIFVFLVIESFYFLYKFLFDGGFHNILFFFLFSSSIFFFRPPVTFFLWMAFASYYVLNMENKTIGILTILCIVGLFFIFSSVIRMNFNRFANEGNITQSYVFLHTSLLGKIVSTIGALTGPYPSFIDNQGVLTYKPLYSSGLLYKFLLFIPFWYGAMYGLKNKYKEIYPLFVFSIIEMVALCFVFDGLELRKALPHVPIFILAAFWFLYKYNEEEVEEMNRQRFDNLLSSSFLFVFVFTLIWNTLR